MLIPLLSDLCFEQNQFGVNGNFAVGFVKLHGESWKQAQGHWERIVKKVLETDAVEQSASGKKAMRQAVTATVTLLETTELRSRCPLCSAGQVGATESEADQNG